jgi:hypothetical protein
MSVGCFRSTRDTVAQCSDLAMCERGPCPSDAASKGPLDSVGDMDDDIPF